MIDRMYVIIGWIIFREFDIQGREESPREYLENRGDGKRERATFEWKINMDD